MIRQTLVVLSLLTVACGPSQEVVAENERLTTRVADLEKEKSRLEREADQLHAKVGKLEEEVARFERRELVARLGIGEGESIGAELRTTKGTIHCELWPQVAPNTVVNFVELAEGTREWTDPATKQPTKRPLYDGTIFHRVIPKFMIQGGDPLGKGTGGPGYKFEDEVSSGVTFDGPGLLAMANSGPATNGSQFFITDRATPEHLNGKHTIFGKCADADVVQAIAETERDGRDRPLTDVVLQKVRVIRGG